MFAFLVTTLLLSWLVPLIAILIKLDSRGPAFFRQLRTGKDYRPFYCLKFRSMTVNTEANEKQAAKDDRRVTRVGKILRRTSLDELPQFLNVLKGEMSVVGPRPHMLKHTDDYCFDRVVDNFPVRHLVIPGITGWAQVTGYRGETKDDADMAGRVKADLWYIRNSSLRLDIKIIFITLVQAFRGSENAY